MTLLERLQSAAADLDGVTSVPAGDAIEFRFAGQVIAVADTADAVEFRLDGAIAAAAQRTPDTGASRRGPDWVRFTPITLDDHAEDRAIAWLGSAARRVATG